MPAPSPERPLDTACMNVSTQDRSEQFDTSYLAKTANLRSPYAHSVHDAPQNAKNVLLVCRQNRFERS